MQTILSPGTPARFDVRAQARVAARFRHCAPESFLHELETYLPATREEFVSFEKFYGWALYDAGDYDAARPHLLRALRRSRPASADRSVVRGLLGEQYLRTGCLDLAERCASRALADLPAVDDGAYLRAGHLCLLSRVHRYRGHLSLALETCRRGLALVGQDSPHWIPLTANAVWVLFLLDRVHEADALVQAHGGGVYARSSAAQTWAMATVEAPVALALGDPARAERVLERAWDAHEEAGERVRFALLEWRAAVHRARGEWTLSEELLQGMLECCEPNGRHGDSLTAAARGLAESLEGQGRYEEALAPARRAARVGASDDRLESAIGLHVLARCLMALGRREEARRVFQEAIGLHERTEYRRELAQLMVTLSRHGLGALAAGIAADGPAPRTEAAAAESLRVKLSDGRAFVTTNRRLLEDLHSAAASDLPVLIEGETGTGKELVARLLHEQGPLARAPFVVVDCATLGAELADAELFGAARGAYTGAHRDRHGLVAQAHGGTLFLDELPLLPLAVQAKLLRVIQEGTYRRIGETARRAARIRFIAATNRSVDELLGGGELKHDLFYRLNGHRITLEPLRNRRAEIAMLAAEFVQRSGLAGMSAATVLALEAHPWPGNVRQLEMALRVAATRCRPGDVLDVSQLGLPAPPPASTIAATLRESRTAWERRTLLQALEENGGVIARAARALGMTRQAFYVAMRRTALGREQRRAPVRAVR